MTIEKIIDIYQSGLCSFNECATSIVTEISVNQFVANIENIPPAVLEEIRILAWSDYDGLFGLYGDVPSEDLLLEYRSALRSP